MNALEEGEIQKGKQFQPSKVWLFLNEGQTKSYKKRAIEKM